MTEALRMLSDHFRRAQGDALTSVANQVIRTAGEAVAEQAAQLAPRRSGRLAQSIQVQTLDADTVRVVATAPYSGDVERGTRPHLITPRRARVLAFKVNGRTVFARAVHHPGTQAEPFMRDAVGIGLGNATDQLGQAGVSLIIDGQAG